MKIKVSRMLKTTFLLLMFVLVISIISCGQPNTSINNISDCYNYPNPFNPLSEDDQNKSTTIRTVFNNNDSVNKIEVNIKIKDVTDSLVWNFTKEIDINSTEAQTNIDIMWSGRSNIGEIVSQGLYKTTVTIDVLENDSGVYGGESLTEVIYTAVE